MLTLAAVALTIGLDTMAAEQAPQAPVPAVFITKEEYEAALKESVAKSVVDQPIKATGVPGGRASVAMLYRVKPEASALIHNDVTETYYILSGSGTLVTGGSLKDAKPTDLTRVNAGMSQTGTRVGGDSRQVKAGDIIIVPPAPLTVSARSTVRSATSFTDSNPRPSNKLDRAHRLETSGRRLTTGGCDADFAFCLGTGAGTNAGGGMRRQSGVSNAVGVGR